MVYGSTQPDVLQQGYRGWPLNLFYFCYHYPIEIHNLLPAATYTNIEIDLFRKKLIIICAVLLINMFE